MSFSSNNENFIKFGLEVPLKGLSEKERIVKYKNEIRIEARRRFKQHFDKIIDDVSQRAHFYEELLETFGFVDAEYIIYSIYFDSDADFLIEHLQPVLTKFIAPDHFLAHVLHRKASLYNNSYIKGYLREFFMEVLDLNSSEWEEEDGTRNPVTYKLTAWLVKSLFSAETPTELLQEVILNYTKLWNIYFVDPYNTKKGVILLHKFIEQYKKLDSSLLTLNFHEILLGLNQKISELLPPIYNSPLTDVNSTSVFLAEQIGNISQSFGYKNKSNEFLSILIQDTIFFDDLSNNIWLDLFVNRCLSKGSSKLAYQKEIDDRYLKGSAPSATEIKEIFEKVPELIANDSADLRTLYSILDQNYIYFYLDK